MIVFKMEDSFLLECESGRVEPLRAALDRYVIAEDVGLESLVESQASFSIEGPRAAEILDRLTGRKLEALEHLQCEPVEIGNVPALVTAHSHERTPRFDVRSAIENAAGILETVLSQGVLLGGELAAEARRIEAGGRGSESTWTKATFPRRRASTAP